jgi:hypothetical protein
MKVTTKVITYGRWLLALAVLSIGTVGHASSPSSLFGGSLPSASGVVAPSFPLFLDTNETIKVTKTGNNASNTFWTLTGTGSNTSFLGSLFKSYDLRSDSVKYVANFNSAGQLITTKPGGGTLTNYLQINGSLPAGNFGNTSWTAKSNQLLLKADLTSVGTWNGVALGFGTHFTGGWAALNTGLTGGSTGESLWTTALSLDFFKLVNALDGNNSNGTLSSLFGSNKTITGVVSVSSVPVPAAVWLFGSGLMAVFAGRRKHAA